MWGAAFLADAVRCRHRRRVPVLMAGVSPIPAGLFPYAGPGFARGPVYGGLRLVEPSPSSTANRPHRRGERLAEFLRHGTHMPTLENVFVAHRNVDDFDAARGAPSTIGPSIGGDTA